MKTGVALFGGTFRRGGAERDLLELLRRVDRNRFDLHMFYVERKGDMLVDYERTGIPMTPLGFSSLKSPAVPGAVARARAYMREHRIRVLHAFGIYAALYGAVIARGPGSPGLISYEFTSTRPRSLRERLFQPWYYRRSAAIVCNSDAVLDMVRGRRGVSEDRLVRIHNGVDISRFSPSPDPDIAAIDGVPAGARVVGSVGRLHPIKGHLDLVRAWPAVTRAIPGVHLAIVGDASAGQRRGVEDLARELGCADTVHLLGLRTDVPALLPLMEIVAVPSHAEGFSNAVIEAGAAARPVVATRVGGNVEALVDGETGLLVPPKDPGAMSRGLVALLSDPQRARRMGESARNRVTRLFTVERMVEQYERLYERVAATAGGAS